MTKKVIAIISVLKPVDDTRNYEKIARSINNTNKYEVNIIGFSAKKIPTQTNIKFHPAFTFGRTSIKRSVASLTIFKILLKVKPELVIVTCAELLIVSIVNKILFGCKIIYDIQENYYRNILFTSSYPGFIKYALALIARSIEVLSYPFINRYILAENVYLTQLKYTISKAIVIENKALIPENVRNMKVRKNKELTFVYSGTIAEHYGIFDAIKFISRLKSSTNHVKLIIIGFAPQRKIYQKVSAIVARLNYITIIGGDALVAHDQILMEMKKADFCLLPYQKNKSTTGRIPTKLYECLAMEKPVIITPNQAWNDIIVQNNAGIIFDLSSNSLFDTQQLYHQYYGNNLSRNYDWDNSSYKLLEIINELI